MGTSPEPMHDETPTVGVLCHPAWAATHSPQRVQGSWRRKRAARQGHLRRCRGAAPPPSLQRLGVAPCKRNRPWSLRSRGRPRRPRRTNPLVWSGLQRLQPRHHLRHLLCLRASGPSAGCCRALRRLPPHRGHRAAHGPCFRVVQIVPAMAPHSLPHCLLASGPLASLAQVTAGVAAPSDEPATCGRLPRGAQERAQRRDGASGAYARQALPAPAPWLRRPCAVRRKAEQRAARR